MEFFKGLINTLVMIAVFLLIMLVIPECKAAGSNTDDYMPVSTAWSRTAVVLTVPKHLGGVADCVIVDADREIIDKKIVRLSYPRFVVFRSPQALEFGALAYCREGE